MDIRDDQLGESMQQELRTRPERSLGETMFSSPLYDNEQIEMMNRIEALERRVRELEKMMVDVDRSIKLLSMRT